MTLIIFLREANHIKAFRLMINLTDQTESYECDIHFSDSKYRNSRRLSGCLYLECTQQSV